MKSDTNNRLKSFNLRELDPSPLLPSSSTAWFEMTRPLLSGRKWSRAGQNFVFGMDSQPPVPASMYLHVTCHPEPPNDGSGKEIGGEGSHTLPTDYVIL